MTCKLGATNCPAQTEDPGVVGVAACNWLKGNEVTGGGAGGGIEKSMDWSQMRSEGSEEIEVPSSLALSILFDNCTLPGCGNGWQAGS